MTEAVKYLGISRVQVSNYLKKTPPVLYKGYIIHKVGDVSETFRSSDKIAKQPMLLTKVERGITQECSSITEAALFLDLSRARLCYFFNNKSDAPFNGYLL